MHNKGQMLRDLLRSTQALLREGPRPSLRTVEGALASSETVDAYLAAVDLTETQPLYLPCPFCGASGDIAKLTSTCVDPTGGDSWASDGMNRWAVRCGECYAGTEVSRSQKDATDLWNQRRAARPSPSSSLDEDPWITAASLHTSVKSLSGMKTKLKGGLSLRTVRYLHLIEMSSSKRKPFITLFELRIKELS